MNKNFNYNKNRNINKINNHPTLNSPKIIIENPPAPSVVNRIINKYPAIPSVPNHAPTKKKTYICKDTIENIWSKFQ